MTRQEMLDKIYGEINFPYDDGDAVYSPVMIGDVMDYQYYNSKHSNITEERLQIIGRWKKLRKPISEQDDDCIQFIFNLL